MKVGGQARGGPIFCNFQARNRSAKQTECFDRIRDVGADFLIVPDTGGLLHDALNQPERDNCRFCQAAGGGQTARGKLLWNIGSKKFQNRTESPLAQKPREMPTQDGEDDQRKRPSWRPKHPYTDLPCEHKHPDYRRWDHMRSDPIWGWGVCSHGHTLSLSHPSWWELQVNLQFLLNHDKFLYSFLTSMEHFPSTWQARLSDTR
jgi:hypothetical protein